ncbi:hypothetical protein KFU94_64090 [Chloroflexi bacterium TSY]|nr:hypothetical protein [Chloroflexi bacterium TSY]
MTQRSFTDFYNNVYFYQEWLAELGYTVQLEPLAIPTEKVADQNDQAQYLVQRITSRYERIPAVNESARRVLYIDPILTQLVDALHCTLRVEYPIRTDALQGTVDYLIEKEGNLVVVEAKGADLERGFAQLTAELVAAHETAKKQRTDNHPILSYGSITSGDVWYFAKLRDHFILRDINPYVLPRQAKDILAILTSMLEGTL